MLTRSVIQNSHSIHLGDNFSDISLSLNTYKGSNPSPLNNTRNQSKNTQSYRKTTNPESKQYRYFEDALTCCCLFDLPPEQAVKEFHEEFKKSPPPNYFQWWCNCWDEYEITASMVREWLTKVNRLGWSERLGIVAAQTQKRGAVK